MYFGAWILVLPRHLSARRDQNDQREGNRVTEVKSPFEPFAPFCGQFSLPNSPEPVEGLRLRRAGLPGFKGGFEMEPRVGDSRLFVPKRNH